MRRFWVLAHRYIGLVMAGFLIVAGATGALIAFYHELEAALAPQLHHVAAPHAGAQPLDPFALRDAVAARDPNTNVLWVDLHQPPETPATFSVEAKPGAAPPAFDEVFVNPYDGSIVAERRYGDLSQGAMNVMPFVYQLHYSLAAGVIGTYLFGFVALLWTIDCFIGAYLTFPRGSGRWFARWRPAWGLRTQSGAAKFTFDLHRAGGLWVWAMLFVFAWSSVAFNLHEVYRPVMKLAVGYEEPRRDFPALAAPLDAPPIDFRDAHRRLQAAMIARAAQDGFTIHHERLIHYDPGAGVYGYRVKSSRDVGDTLGNTMLFMDARDGRMLRFIAPTGQNLGASITTWLFALHMGQVFGLPFRIFVCLMGLVAVMLSVTGVLIWLRKRRARIVRRRNVPALAMRAARERVDA
ncbi:MAG: PepSY-associated TM helix domain-containing protein [Hyphomonadaceae bacterium]|nr:PepSY-associated TM helix domain-containing protein [Hyphomonadaceae bacterium]